LAARLSGALVLAGGLVLLAAALVVAMSGTLLSIGICVALAGLTGVVALGPARAGLITMSLAFATAPAYRGIEGLSGGVATPTDIFLVLSIMLILPGVLSTRRLGLPTPYVAGLTLVTVTGLVASMFAESPIFSIFPLVQWIFFLAGLPIIIAWWRPGSGTVAFLLWSYVLGHMASTAYALAKGPVVGNRYQGLTHHTNAFGMAGMTAMAILLYLFAHHQGTKARVFILGCGAVSLASVVMSGSRAAVVVAAVLVLIIPIVERSALIGFVTSVVAALGIVAIPLLVQSGHGGSALTRLAGDGTAIVADQARSNGYEYGFARFLDSPILGSGLANVELVHDVLLEVAVGIGVFGFAGYVMVMYVLCRPLIGNHPYRRLAYLPVGWLGIAPALPGLFDRTMWVPISLSMLAVIKSDTSPDDGEADDAEPQAAAPDLQRRSLPSTVSW
jgi:hypothetical protein